MRSVFLAPHPDDETLFGAFTLQRGQPLVVCVLDCGEHRTREFIAATSMLGCHEVDAWSFPEAAPDWAAIRERIRGLHADHIYVPAYADGGNVHHNELACAADGAAPITHYLTYTTAGKQTSSRQVGYEREWIGFKLRALACYESQYAHPSHAPHFTRGLDEFYA